MAITSEIRTATLINADNEYLTYPCKVVVHIMERGINEEILTCTVSTGGPFVGARKAKFEDISEILPYQYQHFNPKDLF